MRKMCIRDRVEAVRTMTKIAAQAEKDKLEENDIRIPLDENSNDVTAFLAKQAVKALSLIHILCPPAAATSSALFTFSCPFTSAKSRSQLVCC